MKLFRILMSAADAGGGSSAIPPAQPASVPAAAPANPPAQGGAAPAAAPSIDVKSIVEQTAQAVSDKVFADLRRAGVLGKGKTPAAAPQETPAPDPAAAAANVDLRALDRVLNRSGFATRLSETQYRRIEHAYRAEAPDDVEGWVKQYFEGWGPSTQPAPANGASPASPNPQQRSTQPVSDGGTQPAPNVPLEERDLMSLSPADRAHLINTKGPKWWRETLNKQMAGKSIRLR